MRYLGASLISCALFASAPGVACAQSTPIEWTRERVRISGEIGFATFFPSQYAQSLRLFFYGPLAVGTALAARATLRSHGIVVYGARLGWLHTGTTSSTTLGAIHYNIVDVSALFGIATRQRARVDSLRAELVAEAGGVLGDASLNEVPQLVASFRVGGSAMLGWFLYLSRVYVGARVAVSYIPWNGAGGAFWDPALANITSSIELGGVL